MLRPVRDVSRTTAEPITLDPFFKVFKESLGIQNRLFGELTERMDVIDQRCKDQVGFSKNRISALSIANSPFKDGMKRPSKLKNMSDVTANRRPAWSAGASRR